MVLTDLIETQEWNEYNSLNGAEQAHRAGPALDAIAEAMGWLRARALIAGSQARRPTARLPPTARWYEQGVFVAMKAVEVGVLRLGGFGDDLIGVDLMNKAFGPSGPLADPDAVPDEREGIRALFAGEYAVLRNPAGHREVNYDDIAEAVLTASLLMRILDRVEKRLAAAR
jgi:hypothetical protein